MVAQVRPQVGGLVLRRLFVEGSDVKAGQVLYELDAAPYRAALAQAEATLAKSRASLKATQVTAKRTAELAEFEAISRQDNDDAHANVQIAAADVKLARSARDGANQPDLHAHCRADFRAHRDLGSDAGRLGGG